MDYYRRRKTLPVLKTDEEIEQETHSSSPPNTTGSPPSSGASSANNPSSPCPSPSSSTTPTSRTIAAADQSDSQHWLQLSPDIADEDDTSYMTRHALGFDVPGAVHSVRTPKLRNEKQPDSKLVIIMVGLPARGKSYIVKKLRRYLNWLQYETKVFNVGNLRRINEASQKQDQSAKFFDPDNKDMKKIRDTLALEVLEQLLDWLRHDGRVAIHDATNSTIDRRKLLLDRLQLEPQVKVLLLESVCTDKNVLERNFRLKLLGPDYQNKDPAEALADFRSRVANYERAYEPVGEWEEEHDIQYCKLINVGKKVIANNISGYLSGQCVFYLMNFNLEERQIFLTRHGESMDNLSGRIGGDAPLSPKGRKFARALARFIREQRVKFALDLVERKREQEEEWQSYGLEPLDTADDVTKVRNGTKTPHEIAHAKTSKSQFTVWTSMLKRAVESVQHFDPDEYDIKHIRFLNEINAATCEGMTYEQIKTKYPREFSARNKNKLYYRYPGIGGESYVDVIHRMQSMIIELERMSQSCLIITHRVVMRILLGYLLDWSRIDMPHMDVPIHTVFEIRPKPYGSELKIWKYNDEADTFEEMQDALTPTA
ncbi:6-phosphofructo-2-kinase-domain-containing protein [Syncephalastrum racemosum]|uniref:6-phosphofructo-2-kinase-domain-containing protein n=1 Tax=Syncephalastrum racemosum TaxID=13706 RepID=A0A1X2H258_SYNRA|nr:6-phosphofructo-2-kinase-domain-containing protein [Syncephalastrum racemosum]